MATPPRPRDTLSFPSDKASQIAPYLPHHGPNTAETLIQISTSTSTSTLTAPPKPHLTLTYASSLDSALSLAPGTQTVLSGPASKAMTHHLRSTHDAILIGTGTAIADDPSLNCRIEGAGGYGGEHLHRQPQPVVLDPRGRWNVSAESKVVRLARSGLGLAPWVLSLGPLESGKEKLLEEVGGRVIIVPKGEESMDEVDGQMRWTSVLQILAREGIRSVMVEGGAYVINTLLRPDNVKLVDSVIVTIAPTWLGGGSVKVCPDEKRVGDAKVPVGRLGDVKWIPLDEDVVLCGRPQLR